MKGVVEEEIKKNFEEKNKFTIKIENSNSQTDIDYWRKISHANEHWLQLAVAIKTA